MKVVGRIMLFLNPASRCLLQESNTSIQPVKSRRTKKNCLSMPVVVGCSSHLSCVQRSGERKRKRKMRVPCFVFLVNDFV